MGTETGLELGIDTPNTRRVRDIACEVGAYLRGQFTLSSGRRSNYYFDGKRVTLSPEGAYHVGKAMFDQLVDIGIEAVGGVPVGAYPIVAAVALVSHLEGRPIPAFIVREETKKHGTRRVVEGYFRESSKVAILDDVITTGGSLLRVLKTVEEADCKVVKIVVLLDRREGGSTYLKEAGYNFSALLTI